jgi:hypothetical protein
LDRDGETPIQRGSSKNPAWKLYGAKMGKDELVEEFSVRLLELSCGFPEQVNKLVLLPIMLEGLPNELKLQAAVTSSDFDVAVKQLS